MKIKKISLIIFGIILLYCNQKTFSTSIEEEYYQHILKEYKNKKIGLDTYYQAAPSYGCQVTQYFTKGPYTGLFRVRSTVKGQDWTKFCEAKNCNITDIQMGKVVAIKINPDYTGKDTDSENPQGRIVGYTSKKNKWVSCMGDVPEPPSPWD